MAIPNEILLQATGRRCDGENEKKWKERKERNGKKNRKENKEIKWKERKELK